MLKPFIKANGISLSEARELRRALETVFGGKVRLDITSVRRVKPTARRL